MMGLTISSSKPFDLMQNCDLPPPSRVFKGSDTMLVMPPRNHRNDATVAAGGDSDVLEILKALRSSQTRAREAETKAANLMKQRDCISNALIQEAMRLYAYRQQVRLLDIQVSNSRRNMNMHMRAEPEEGFKKEDDDNGEERVSLMWILALALSWGFGVGTAIVCRYVF